MLPRIWVVLLTVLLLAAHAGAPAADTMIDAEAASSLVDDEVVSQAVSIEQTPSKPSVRIADGDERAFVSPLVPRVFRPPRA